MAESATAHLNAKAAAPGEAGAPAAPPAAMAAPQTDAAQRSSAAVAGTTGAAGATTTAAGAAQSFDRMVIRTAQLSVEVANIEPALAQARAIASRGGGFVSASNTRVEKVNDQERMIADLTIQVRSDSADATLSDLRALGKVTTETSGSQDVTEEFTDLESNLRNLQASESAILKLMDKASRIEDVVALQRELTSIRGQIERIQGRKRYLERRSDMATITLALRLPPVESSRPGTGWDPISVAQRGWQASLTVLRTVAEALIVAAAFSWWLIPLIALGVYIWMQRRRGPAAASPPPASTPVTP
jgi:hypothetical protein